MRTDKQREASRLNSLKSTGPRTQEGKAASSRNSYKLGINVSDAAFYQDPDARQHLDTLLEEYEQHYRPQTPFERDTLQEIALCEVRLARLHRIEEGLYTDGRERTFATQSIAGPDGKPLYRFDLNNYPAEERPVVAEMHLAASWRQSQDTFDALTRQETRLSHRLRRAQQRFDQLLKARKNEPEPLPQPEPVPSKNEATPHLTPTVSQPPQPPVTPPPAAEPDPAQQSPRKGPTQEVA